MAANEPAFSCSTMSPRIDLWQKPDDHGKGPIVARAHDALIVDQREYAMM